MKMHILIGMILVLLTSCKKNNTVPGNPVYLQLISVSVGTEQLSTSQSNIDLPNDQPVVFRFSQAVDRSSVETNIFITSDSSSVGNLSFSFLDNDKTVSVLPSSPLNEYTTYTISIKDGLKGKKNEVFTGLDLVFTTIKSSLEVLKSEIDGKTVQLGTRITGCSFNPVITIHFSKPVAQSILEGYVSLLLGSVPFNFTLSQVNDSVISVQVTDQLPYYLNFRFSISPNLTSEIGRNFAGYSFDFFTKVDETPKFPLLSDDDLLSLVQQMTFKYFWDFGHSVSGLSRERNTSGEVVTIGGSGFGIMTIPVGIERGFITRNEGVARLTKIVNFLATADRFHGVWPHWMNGTTGKVIPFSQDDNGGDLVETSYMAMGLTTTRQYLHAGVPEESDLIDKIDTLLNGIEWDWYTQGQNSLTWHWSPNYLFQKNMKIRGWNEALITYIMAASSTNHSISKEVYEQGWASGSNMLNGKSFYGTTLPLGPDYGGPLFFEQYTFLGLDPRNLSDQYANYWEQVVNHTLINRQHCIVNPYNYVGYNDSCWGLTASDNDQGYSAHSPTNDRGVITPTAAISSFPYTPVESMQALKHFYYILGDRLWGPYGFYDAFNVTASWYATSDLAIDQGPILLMIENYRTGLLWNLFMSAPEIKTGLTKLGFNY